MWFQRLACLIAVLAIPACAATPTSVPGHAEPHHHLQFQNGYVRVMETRLEPGQETLAHSHPNDAAVIFLTDGRMRIRNDDGTSRESELKRDTVAFGLAPIVHHAANVGEEPVRVVTVEIFSRPPTRDAVPALSSLGEVLLENDTVRMSRVRLSRDEAIQLPGTTPSVVVATSRGSVTYGGSRTKLETGGALWCDGADGELRYEGRKTFEAIIVTLKPRV